MSASASESFGWPALALTRSSSVVTSAVSCGVIEAAPCGGGLSQGAPQNVFPPPGTSRGARSCSGAGIAAYPPPDAAMASASNRERSSASSLLRGWWVSDHRLKPYARLSVREIYISPFPLGSGQFSCLEPECERAPNPPLPR